MSYLWLILPLGNMGRSLVEAVSRDYLENWLCSLDMAFWRAGPIFHQWQHLGEQTLHLTKVTQWRWP